LSNIIPLLSLYTLSLRERAGVRVGFILPHPHPNPPLEREGTLCG